MAVCQVLSADGGGGAYTSVYSNSFHGNLLASLLLDKRCFIFQLRLVWFMPHASRWRSKMEQRGLSYQRVDVQEAA
ncbi:hypothetical protein MHYP_G00331730 [Metynnis hypsauchen]